MSLVDNAIAIRVLMMLVTPFDKTDAFKYGIIDKDGKTLRKVSSLKTMAENDSYSMLHRMVFKLKRMLGTIPGGKSTLASYAAAYMLVKEHYDLLSEDNIEELFIDSINHIEDSELPESLYEELSVVIKEEGEGAIPANVSANIDATTPRIRARKFGKKFKRLPPLVAKTIKTEGIQLDSGSLLVEVKINNKEGVGAVPYNQNVDYMGLRVMMKPTTFLKLAHRLDSSSDESRKSIEFIKSKLNEPGIGAPWFYVDIPEEWFDGDFTKMAEIGGHEGRHRMNAILEAEGDAPVEVHLFFRGGVRNRDITDEFKQHLQAELRDEAGSATVYNPFKIVEGVEYITEISKAELGKKMKTDVPLDATSFQAEVGEPTARAVFKHEWFRRFCYNPQASQTVFKIHNDPITQFITVMASYDNKNMVKFDMSYNRRKVLTASLFTQQPDKKWKFIKSVKD